MRLKPVVLYIYLTPPVQAGFGVHFGGGLLSTSLKNCLNTDSVDKFRDRCQGPACAIRP